MTAKRRNVAQSKCEACQKEYPQYTTQQKYCSYACHYKANYINLDAVKRKAITLASPIRFGEGRKAFFDNLVASAIGTPCPYCGAVLNLHNLSLDHKEPVLGDANRKLHALNKAENLHLVCKPCNTLKSDMSDAEFLIFLQFLKDQPAIAGKLKRRLGQANILWRFKRGR